MGREEEEGTCTVLLHAALHCASITSHLLCLPSFLMTVSPLLFNLLVLVYFSLQIIPAYKHCAVLHHWCDFSSAFPHIIFEK